VVLAICDLLLTCLLCLVLVAHFGLEFGSLVGCIESLLLMCHVGCSVWLGLVDFYSCYSFIHISIHIRKRILHRPADEMPFISIYSYS